jgi:probable F420-dependent oxidoreductase
LTSTPGTGSHEESDVKFWLAVAFADPGELFDLARAADDSGWHGLTISDHIVAMRELSTPYPYTADGKPGWEPDTSWPDPWVTIGALSAITTNLRFTTNIYVAPMRDVVSVAKVAATAAVLSGNRVSVGVAPGWCAEEFALTGQDFATRGKRLNEMIPALRALWTGDWTSSAGDHVAFPELKISPTPDQPVPIYVGGDTSVALKRAARLADGWIGTLYRPEEAEAKVTELRGYLRDAGRDGDDFEIVLSLLARDDAELFRRMQDIGVTGIIHAPWLMAQPADGQPLLDARVAAIKQFGEQFITA